MPRLLLLGGPTGVGKSSTLERLESRLPRLAVLDADDVWRVSEDLAVDGTRGIAIANVAGVLRGYARAQCETAILGWVFARSELYQPVIDQLKVDFESIHQLYLVASEAALEARLARRNDLDRLAYSLSRLALIKDLPHPKIDTTHLTSDEVAERIASFVRMGELALGDR